MTDIYRVECTLSIWLLKCTPAYIEARDHIFDSRPKLDGGSTPAAAWQARTFGVLPDLRVLH